jgi:hypothetical protein
LPRNAKDRGRGFPGFIRGVAALACVIGLLCSPATPRAVGAYDSQPGTTVRIGVFSLFRPTELRLGPADGTALVLEMGGQSHIVAGGAQGVVVRVAGGLLEIEFPGEGGRLRGDRLAVHAQFVSDRQRSSRFWLEVPGKLRREYAGTLEITVREHVLEAVVTMPLETAVASIVLAESPPGAGMEALKAQAVATRSFLMARRAAHVDFDFCDTTHCQFLRSPAPEGSPAELAIRATAGLVLTWHDNGTAQEHTLAAMYARSCGGRTRTLREIGARDDGYPYYSVQCAYCMRHPERWQRTEDSSQSQGEPVRTESDRLAFNRIHGWGALPSVPENQPGTGFASTHTAAGRGYGHGVGLCQLGAAAMARRGATFAQILSHYYPNTRLVAAPAV